MNGGDLHENGHFTEVKRIAHLPKSRDELIYFHGDDATENDDFQIRKQRLEGYKIFMGTISRYNLKTSRIEPGTFTSVILRGGDLEENDDFQMGSERLHDCFKASRLELGTLTWVVFRGGDLGEIDDFQLGSERLHDCFRHF